LAPPVHGEILSHLPARRGGRTIALRYPVAGLAMCIGCIVFYLRPKLPWAQAADSIDAEES